jgi:hypothetical protein
MARIGAETLAGGEGGGEGEEGGRPVGRFRR